MEEYAITQNVACRVRTMQSIVNVNFVEMSYLMVSLLFYCSKHRREGETEAMVVGIVGGDDAHVG